MPSPDKGSKINFCMEHKKIAELVCMTDLKTICSDCVLFGFHKEHDYKKYEVFKGEAKKTLDEIKR